MRPRVMVFDLFGTLLDIGSLAAAAANYCDDPRALVATWREKQLGYAFAAALMDRYEDFDALTARALRYAAARHNLTDESEGWQALNAAWCDVRPYPDALPALAALQALDVRCAVLTNGTPQTARRAIASAGMADAIEVTLSVDAVRTYKPDRRVYELATTHYATSPDQIVFVTANGWDATGAAAFGMRVAWCNRNVVPAETFGPAPEWTIAGLGDLSGIVAILREENSASIR